MIETLLEAGLWLCWSLVACLWGSVALCWLCFLYAWVRGELNDDTTPAQILDGTNRKTKA